MDSRGLIAAIEESLEAGNGAELARAAHAWRSYNGNVGAVGLAQLCRELEEAARAGNFSAARTVYAQIQRCITAYAMSCNPKCEEQHEQPSRPPPAF